MCKCIHKIFLKSMGKTYDVCCYFFLTRNATALMQKYSVYTRLTITMLQNCSIMHQKLSYNMRSTTYDHDILGYIVAIMLL